MRLKYSQEMQIHDDYSERSSADIDVDYNKFLKRNPDAVSLSSYQYNLCSGFMRNRYDSKGRLLDDQGYGS